MCSTDGEEPSPIIKKVFKGTLFAIVLGVVMTIFIPSTKNLLIIYGVGGTIDYLKENKDANKIPDKCVKALDKYLDDAYRKLVGMDFGKVIEELKFGLAVRRKGWNDKGMFVVKQFPSHIEGSIIPTMQSLPPSAKHILLSRENAHIDYTNQMLIINSDGRADSWVPSVSDIFAEDREVVQTEDYGDCCPNCSAPSASPIED